jgi:hypothetical protein
MILRKSAIPEWEYDDDGGNYVNVSTGDVLSPNQFHEVREFCGASEDVRVSESDNRPVRVALCEASLSLENVVSCIAHNCKWDEDVNPDLEVGETDTKTGSGTENKIHPIYTSAIFHLDEAPAQQLTEFIWAVEEALVSIKRRLDSGEQSLFPFHEEITTYLRNWANEMPIPSSVHPPRFNWEGDQSSKAAVLEFAADRGFIPTTAEDFVQLFREAVASLQSVKDQLVRKSAEYHDVFEQYTNAVTAWTIEAKRVESLKKKVRRLSARIYSGAGEQFHTTNRT